MREQLGWGPTSKRVPVWTYTYLPKVHGPCPIERRKRRKHKRPLNSARVFLRDGYACRKCGSLWNITVDHIIPQSCGGDDSEFNLTTLCRPCNTRRGAYLPNPTVLL